MELEATFMCMYCFQVNEIFVVAAEGLRQEFVQDCEVCCKPNRLTITVNPDQETAEVEVDIP